MGAGGTAWVRRVCGRVRFALCNRERLAVGDTQTADDGSAPRIAVVDAEHGQRVDNFLLAQLKGLPRSRIYRMVRRGEVRVNGARAQPSLRLRRGDAVRIPPHRPGARAGAGGDPGAVPARLAARLREGVLYEDARLLVLDKPSGVAVHGGSGVSLGVVEALRLAEPGVRFELAHRLDRDTSGCLLVAKQRAMLLALHEQFRAGKVGKRYELIVRGRWPRRRSTVAEPLERYRLPSGERRVRVSANGEPAHTSFAVCRRAEDATWLAATPRTGRTHQIRVHAACAGHPILGDDKYDRDGPPARRLMLHGAGVECEIYGVKRRFHAPLPAAFADWWGDRGDAKPAD